MRTSINHNEAADGPLGSEGREDGAGALAVGLADPWRATRAGSRRGGSGRIDRAHAAWRASAPTTSTGTRWRGVTSCRGTSSTGSEFNKAIRDHNLDRAGCWSHLRTYFFKARHHHPGEGVLALGTIRDLFMIERDLHGLDPPEVREQRQALAKSLVDGFFERVKALSTNVRPNSALGDAIRYARNQEQAMRL